MIFDTSIKGLGYAPDDDDDDDFYRDQHEQDLEDEAVDRMYERDERMALDH